MGVVEDKLAPICLIDGYFRLLADPGRHKDN